MQNIVLDNIKFPTGKEKDEARFRQIQEERLNRNFRRLLEAGLGEEYNQIINDLKTDVDALKNGTFENPLDVIPRRAYATLSSAGWYRVCTAKDESGVTFDFTIGRKYGTVRAEAHKITMLMVGGGKSVFVNESSATNVLCIDKIRCTYGDFLVHFDIHFNASSSEEVYVDYVVSCNPNVKSTCESEELTSVNDAPVGETILTTYNFIADKRIGSFGTPVTISIFPYTVKEDGFMCVEMRCSSTGRCYANFTGVFICDGYTVAGGYINGTFPVKKGTTLPTPSESNLQSVKYTWYPLG